MKHTIEVLCFIGFLWGFYGLILCWAAAKRTPIPPGCKCDERGEYGSDSSEGLLSPEVTEWTKKL
jgi:hypothetical protein